MGNQGGIRSAVLLGFGIPKEAFVATATAIGLIVDAARLPVYLATEPRAIGSLWPLLLAASIGGVVGTIVGAKILKRIPEAVFQRIVSVLILLLGCGDPGPGRP